MEWTQLNSTLNEWIASGHQIGAQVYISRAGEALADFAIGESRPGVPMSTDTLMLWLSAGKPFAAVALAQLRERGLLDFDDPVVKFIPEFGQQGKEAITLAHLLTHTAGLRFIETGWPSAGWDDIIATICAASPEAGWPIGEKAGYSPFASWFILAEVVRRLDGRNYADYVREEIFTPLGMNDSWLALPNNRYADYGDRIGILMNAAKKPAEPGGNDTPQAAAACRPSGGARGPARELGRFYEMMLNGGAIPGSAMRSSSGSPAESTSLGEMPGGSGPMVCEAASGDRSRDRDSRERKRILSRESVDFLTAPRRVGLFDHAFRHVMDWSLGFIVNSARHGVDTVPYGYGPNAGPRAFGHGGAQSTCALADPDRRLVVVITFNGQPGEPAHHRRLRATLTAMERDLEDAVSE